MEPTVVIKQECDDGDDVTINCSAYTTRDTPPTFLPVTLDIKQEEPIHIKADVDCISNNSHNLLSTTHTTSVADSVYNAETLSVPEFAESFVIYELEPVPANAPEVRPTTIATTVHCQPTATAPPILLNAKLRKRPRVDNVTSSTVSTVAKSKTVSSTQVVTAPKRAPAHTIGELKVKCFCRLGNHSGGASTADSLALKRFFEEMFNETRQLTRAQQRLVKMTLLEAVCQAEEDAEAGRCCEKCCT